MVGVPWEPCLRPRLGALGSRWERGSRQEKSKNGTWQEGRQGQEIEGSPRLPGGGKGGRMKTAASPCADLPRDLPWAREWVGQCVGLRAGQTNLTAPSPSSSPAATPGPWSTYLPTWVPPRPLSQPPLCKALSLQTSLVNPSTFSLAEPSAGFKTLLSRHDQLIDCGRQGISDPGAKASIHSQTSQGLSVPTPSSLHPDLLPAAPQTQHPPPPLPHSLPPPPKSNQRQLRGTTHTARPDLILPVGPLCHPLYPLKGSSACRGLGWGTQAASCPTLPPLQAPVGTGSPKGAGAPLGWAPGR